MDKTQKITGIVESINKSFSDFFAIANVKIYDQLSSVKCIGKLINIDSGDTVELEGAYSVHEKYGEQFKVVSCKVVIPQNKEGVIKWLSKMPGVGYTIASRIVEMFGDKSFDIIKKNPKKLVNVKGISKRMIMDIHHAYMQVESQTGMQIQLRKFGLSDSQIAKCILEFKDPVESIKDNPYVLMHLDNIGFITADAIALKMGVSEDHLERGVACMIHILDDAKHKGDLYLTNKQLGFRCGKLKCLEAVKNVSKNEKLLKERGIIRDIIEDDKSIVQLDECLVCEKVTCSNIGRLTESNLV